MEEESFERGDARGEVLRAGEITGVGMRSWWKENGQRSRTNGVGKGKEISHGNGKNLEAEKDQEMTEDGPLPKRNETPAEENGESAPAPEPMAVDPPAPISEAEADSSIAEIPTPIISEPTPQSDSEPQNATTTTTTTESAVPRVPVVEVFVPEPQPQLKHQSETLNQEDGVSSPTEAPAESIPTSESPAPAAENS